LVPLCERERICGSRHLHLPRFHNNNNNNNNNGMRVLFLFHSCMRICMRERRGRRRVYTGYRYWVSVLPTAEKRSQRVANCAIAGVNGVKAHTLGHMKRGRSARCFCNEEQCTFDANTHSDRTDTYRRTRGDARCMYTKGRKRGRVFGGWNAGG